MNQSSARVWDIPPPPGTEEEELSNCSSKKDGSMHSGRAIDRIDPYIKAPEYLEYERKYSSERGRYRSRSRSRGRYHRKRHSRSRSRDRHRRSRSRSRRRHRRRHSSSRSSSRSPGYRHSRRRHGRRRHSSSRYSRSRSRSTSRSRKLRASRSKKDRKSPTPHKAVVEEQPVTDADINEVDMKIEEEEEEEDELDATKDNFFKNDGSFLEMFKKLQEQQKAQQESQASEEAKKPAVPVFGKRRGGKVLKTGLVQKVRLTNEEESNAQDAWSVYMKEVRRYKEACCDDDSKTRPLVK